MRPFRVGRCIFPLASRPQGCQLRRTLYNSHGFCSSSTLRIGSAEEQQTVRKRGRPRKNVDSSPLQSSVTASVGSSSLSNSHFQSDLSSTSTSDIPIDSLMTGVSSQKLPLEKLPSPHPEAALTSAKLAALHARLSLPKRVSLQLLARTLVHPSADPNPDFNNASLAVLGNDLMGFYMAEHLLAKYPRLPMTVVFAAQHAYVGPSAAANIVESWGVEVAAAPGGEVDPGLLQFRRAPPGAETRKITNPTRPDKRDNWRRGVSSRIVYDDQYGDLQNKSDATMEVADLSQASTSFFRALAGAVYLESGAEAAYKFFKDHILSRHLDISTLFSFTMPTRDLSRLCAREGFAAPLARLISETGRLSRHPVFVVGVYSGEDELGQAAGASLDEARFKAAIAALKSWYLYSPPGEVTVPSRAEIEASLGKPWKPIHIDIGEVVD